MTINPEAIREFTSILTPEHVNFHPETFLKIIDNTIGVQREITGILHPASTDEVQKIILTANKHQIPLYPISRGMNIGYGERTPASDGQIIVDLKRMDQIREFDNHHGFAVVEPGVTQKKLYDFLLQNNSKFWMDATGAGIESSIIGNTLEGGFGHTPKGNHREVLSDTEVVLGNGTILNTGIFPGYGPDLSGMFIQSNLGIITAMRVELMPIPEHFESFVIKVATDKGLEQLVETISYLRSQNILTSLVHIANALRSLMSMQTCPDAYKDRLISCDMAQKIMSTAILKIGYWSAIGGLYGTADEIKARKNELKKCIQKFGSIMFFNDRKISRLRKLSFNPVLKALGLSDTIQESVNSYEPIHGLMKGIPSDEPLNNIKWRVHEYENMGLIWFAPTIPATGESARQIVSISNALYQKHGFECPITMTLVKPDRIVGILSIGFDKSNNKEKERAHELYHSLKEECAKQDIPCYRSGIMGMKKIQYSDLGKREVLESLKKTFDPNNIIAPGRYGIGSIDS